MGRRRFKPPVCNRDYKTLFIIAVEGDVTEKRYFEFLSNHLDSAVAEIKVIPPKSRSAPQHVLHRLKQYTQKTLPNTYQCWMVVDRDQWNADLLQRVYQQCLENRFGFCISNPAFEFWLLLHFEKGKGITTANDCKQRLQNQRYLPNFNKNITQLHWNVLFSKIQTAVKHAKELDKPQYHDWLYNHCGSTVYKLVQELLERI
jgi:hypothetical protein